MTNPDKPTGKSLELITSSTNPQIKALKTLERKKGRREQNAFLAEGARLIEEGLSHGWKPQTVICSPDGLERTFVADLISRAEGSL